MISSRDKIIFCPPRSDRFSGETATVPGFKSELVGYLRPYFFLVGDNLHAVHAGVTRGGPQPTHALTPPAVITSACLAYDAPDLNRAIFATSSGLYLIDHLAPSWPRGEGLQTHHLNLQLLPGEKLHQPLLVDQEKEKEVVVLSSKGRLIRFPVRTPASELQDRVKVQDSEFPRNLTAGPAVFALGHLFFEGIQFTGRDKIKIEAYRRSLAETSGGLQTLKSMSGDLSPAIRPLAAVRQLHGPIWAEDIKTLIFSSAEFNQLWTVVVRGDDQPQFASIDLPDTNPAAHWNAACFQNGQALLPEMDTGRIRGLRLETGQFEEASIAVSLDRGAGGPEGDDRLAHPLLVLRSLDGPEAGKEEMTLIALTKQGQLSRFIHPEKEGP